MRKVSLFLNGFSTLTKGRLGEANMANQNTITHYPVDNGDMTLIQIGPKGTGKTVLVDMRIRENNEDSKNQFDVATDIYKHLPTKANGAPYVDLFILTHPDDDHCLGFEKYMYAGAPNDWIQSEEDEPEKIIMDEIWFSEICTRRVNASEDFYLSPDAKAFRTEAKRRRSLFEDMAGKECLDKGDKLKVIGMDEDDSDKGESWNLDGMVINRGDEVFVGDAKALILAPFGEDIFDDEHQEDKNSSSIIIRWTINHSQVLLGGDATAHIWKHIWEERMNDKSQLMYDVLVAPHHCSWRSLSYDSARKTDNPQVLQEAYNALSQTQNGAFIVSSSKKINSNEPDPPSHLAKDEYVRMLSNDKKHFVCLADSGSSSSPPSPSTFNLSMAGASLIAFESTLASVSPIPKRDKPIRHGQQ